MNHCLKITVTVHKFLCILLYCDERGRGTYQHTNPYLNINLLAGNFNGNSNEIFIFNHGSYRMDPLLVFVSYKKLMKISVTCLMTLDATNFFILGPVFSGKHSAMHPSVASVVFNFASGVSASAISMQLLNT